MLRVSHDIMSASLHLEFLKRPCGPVAVLGPNNYQASGLPSVRGLVQKTLPPVHVLPAVAPHLLPAQAFHQLARPVLVGLRDQEGD